MPDGAITLSADQVEESPTLDLSQVEEAPRSAPKIDMSKVPGVVPGTPSPAQALTPNTKLLDVAAAYPGTIPSKVPVNWTGKPVQTPSLGLAETAGAATELLAPGTIMPGRLDTSPAETVKTGVKELQTPGQRVTGALRTTAGGLEAAAPLAGPMAVENPFTFARAMGEGYVAGKAGKYGAKAVGATPEQQEQVESIGQMAPILGHAIFEPKFGAAVGPKEVVVRGGAKIPVVGEVGAEVRIPRKGAPAPAGQLQDPTIPPATAGDQAWEAAKGKTVPEPSRAVAADYLDKAGGDPNKARQMYVQDQVSASGEKAAPETVTPAKATPPAAAGTPAKAAIAKAPKPAVEPTVESKAPEVIPPEKVAPAATQIAKPPIIELAQNEIEEAKPEGVESTNADNLANERVAGGVPVSASAAGAANAPEQAGVQTSGEKVSVSDRTGEGPAVSAPAKPLSKGDTVTLAKDLEVGGKVIPAGTRAKIDFLHPNGLLARVTTEDGTKISRGVSAFTKAVANEERGTNAERGIQGETKPTAPQAVPAQSQGNGRTGHDQANNQEIRPTEAKPGEAAPTVREATAEMGRQSANSPVKSEWQSLFEQASEIQPEKVDSLRKMSGEQLRGEIEAHRELTPDEKAKIDRDLKASKEFNYAYKTNPDKLHVGVDSDGGKQFYMPFIKDGARIGSGHVSARPDIGEGVAETHRVDIDEAHQGKGLAKELYRQLYDTAKQQGFTRMVSDSVQEPKARRAWEGMVQRGLAKEFKDPYGATRFEYLGGKSVEPEKAVSQEGTPAKPEDVESIKARIAELEAKKSAPAKAIAQKLRDAADSLSKQVEQKRNPAISNQNITARRSRIAEGMGKEADALETTQKHLEKLADAHEAGTVPESLAGVRTRPQVEALKREKYPQPWINKANLRELLEATKSLPGTKDDRSVLGRASMRGSEDTGFHLYGDDEIGAFDRLKARAEAKGTRTTYWNTYGLDEYKRLKNAGIDTPEKFAQARADLKELSGEVKPTNTKEQQIKKAERDLIGVKIPGFFPTPRPVINKMLAAADIQPGDKVLEPSAGKGDIADAIREQHPDAKLDTVEQQSSLRHILELKGHNVAGDDFLEHKGEYDKIVMNPPFERGADATHVERAYQLLKPGGRLVAIMSEGTFFRETQVERGFRDWLNEHDGTSEKLESGSFTGKDAFRQTGVASRMVTIDKPESKPVVATPEKARPESLKTAADAGRDAGLARRRGDDSLAQDIMAGNAKYLNGQPEGVRKEILAAFNKAYHAEADKPVKSEWRNLDEKIVWRGKTMTRSEAIEKEPAASDDILAARPAESYGPKKSKPPTEKIAEAAGEVGTLEARAEKEGARRLTPEETVPKSGRNFEGRYLQAALEPVAEAWDKIEAKYADHTISWAKDTEHNRREGLRVNMHDPEGNHVAALDVRRISSDNYQVYAPGYVKDSKYGTNVIQVLENVRDFSTAKKLAESRLRSGQVYNPDAMWHQKNGVGKGLKTSEVNPASSLKPDNAKPSGFKEEKLLVKVPDDGTFVVPNHPAAIDRAIDAADNFVPTKEGSAARRVSKSPDEFNAEKYITGIEKEIADLQDQLGKANSLQKPYIEEQLKAARENLSEAKKTEPESILTGESGSFTPAALNPLRIQQSYQSAVSDLIDKKLKLGDKYWKVKEYDPEVADTLHLVDNAPRYFREKAQANLAKVTKGLNEDQIRLTHLMVDSDSRDDLEANHPDEYDKAINDPEVMKAVGAFKPLQEELTKDRQALGWPVRKSLTINEDQTAANPFIVMDRKGNPVADFKTETQAEKFVEQNATIEPHLKRTYPEHSRSPLPGDVGPGPFTGSFYADKGLRPPKMDRKSREASAQYHYEHGRKDFSGYLDSYAQTKEAVLKQSLFDHLSNEGTFWKAGTAQPPTIEYQGKTYYRPDLVKKAAQPVPGKGPKSATVLPEYSVYDPSRGEKFLIKTPDYSTMSTGKPGIGPNDRYLAPKVVVDALENYDASRGGNGPSSLRRFFQEQIVGLFGPAVHVNNILRHLGQATGTGAVDPRSWPSIAKVIASPKLRERMMQGVDDATIDMLVKRGAFTDWSDIGSLNHYIGGNLNPLNWIRAAGKGILFDPKFAGGWGGLDPKARVVIADYLKEHAPGMSEQQVADAVNDALGNYNRANWTERQKMLAKFTLFPGWDTASAKWFLRHPFKVGIAGALVVLAVNLALKKLGLVKGDDAYDFSYIHLGDRKYRTGLVSDSMGEHFTAPILSGAEAYLKGDDVAAGVTQGVMKGTSSLVGQFSGPTVEMIADQIYNRKYAGGASEIVNPQDRYTPGTWAPNRELEKRIAFAALKGFPALNRFLSPKGDLDWKQGSGSVVGVSNYKYGAEERLKSNGARAMTVSQTLSRLAATDPDAAAKFVEDPNKAIYLTFNGYFSQMEKDLKEIDTQIERVRLSDLPSEDRRQAIESLKDSRVELLNAAEAVNDQLIEAKLQSKR